MNEDILAKLEAKFPAVIADFKSPRKARIYFRLTGGQFKDVLVYLMKDLGYSHLSTLTAIDNRTEFEVIYNLFGKNTGVSMAVKVDRSDPRIDTITDIVPGALVHEREIQDMMGIKVNNIPDGRRLIIPEDWPQDQYPLRKDWNISMLPESFNDGLLRKWRE